MAIHPTSTRNFRESTDITTVKDYLYSQIFGILISFIEIRIYDETAWEVIYAYSLQFYL